MAQKRNNQKNNSKKNHNSAVKFAPGCSDITGEMLSGNIPLSDLVLGLMNEKQRQIEELSQNNEKLKRRLETLQVNNTTRYILVAVNIAIPAIIAIVTNILTDRLSNNQSITLYIWMLAILAIISIAINLLPILLFNINTSRLTS